jgi:hypothetical protein
MKPRIVHGTPITPARWIHELAGESFCVSHSDPRALDAVLRLQDPEGILILDNGAFSVWRSGRGSIDRDAFFRWANEVQYCSEVAVAVIPDVIGGKESDNWHEAAYAVHHLSDFPERLMYVWHMTESLELLVRAARLFNFIGIGSCGEYDVERKRHSYRRRLKLALAALSHVHFAYRRRPWVHLMRGLGVYKDVIVADSADSTNVARNHRRGGDVPGHVRALADRIAAPIHRRYRSARPVGWYPQTNFAESNSFEERA